MPIYSLKNKGRRKQSLKNPDKTPQVLKPGRR